MANGNDPANIPYIIVDNGFYYVAYKEKVKVPEIVVSAKGVANGLSEEYNDGCDFGPDSYDPNSTANPPYTQTTGTQEMFDYVSSRNVGARVYFAAGEYIFNATATYTGTVPISLYGVFSNIQGGAHQPGAVLMPGSDLPSGSYLISFNPSLSGASEYYGMEGFDIYGQTVSPSTATTSNYNGIYCGSATQAIFKNIHTSQINIAFYINVEFWGEDIMFDSYTAVGIYTDPNFEYQLTTLNNIVTYNIGTLINSQVSTSVAGGVILISELVTNTSKGTYILQLSNTLVYISQYISFGAVTGTSEGLYLGSSTYLYISDSSISGQITAAAASGSAYTCGIFFNNVKVNNTLSSSIDLVNYVGSGNYILNWNGGMAAGTAFNYSSGGAVAYWIRNVVGVDRATPDLGTISPTPSLQANPPVSGSVYQNLNPYDIEIDLPVYATTAGTAGYVTVAKGLTNTPTAIGNQYVSGDTSDTSEQIIRLRVPARWYYEFTASGVTFGTASVFAD